MGEVVNLRRRRKAKLRAEEEALAGRRRLVFGRTKTERTETDHAKAKAEALLDGHRREGVTESQR